MKACFAAIRGCLYFFLISSCLAFTPDSERCRLCWPGGATCISCPTVTGPAYGPQCGWQARERAGGTESEWTVRQRAISQSLRQLRQRSSYSHALLSTRQPSSADSHYHFFITFPLYMALATFSDDPRSMIHPVSQTNTITPAAADFVGNWQELVAATPVFSISLLSQVFLE